MTDLLIQHGATVAAVSLRGGTVTSFAVEEVTILHPWGESGGKARGGSPICAPWHGASPRGEKKHGHLRDLQAARPVSKGPRDVRLEFRHAGDEAYPWSLVYGTHIAVGEKTLTVELWMSREDDKACGRAPILPAFHPYFACQDASAIQVRMGEEVHCGFSAESRRVPITSTTVLIEMPERRVEMKLGGSFSPCASQLVFWTDEPRVYACVEPVLGDKTAFDTPEGYSLGVNENIHLSMSLKVL